nr:MAG TPA: hypothetical protein [Caudoviricetes sp.]
MLYLDYAKPIGEGYILNFFADKVEDIQEVSNGKRFVTKNGMDYGVPMASSTVVITTPDKIKKTYILGEDGEWKEGGGSSVQADYAQNDSTQPDYIKNRLVYGENTESFGFKVISGELTPNSTMIVEFNGVQYTDTVQTLDLDANMEEDDGEAHELAYYIGNGEYFGAEKRDFPFAYSNSSILSLEEEGNVVMMGNLDAQKGDVVSLGDKLYGLKSYSEDSLLYAGNLHLASPEAEDTGENFVILVNYVNMYDVNMDEQTAPTPAYSTLIIFKNNNISFAISKPIKKLYEAYIEIPTVEQNIANLDTNLRENIANLKVQDDALSKKIQEIDTVEKIEVKDNGQVFKSLKPNVFYDFTGSLTQLCILTLENNDSSKAYEYKGQFKSGATAPSLSFPSDVKIIGSSIEPNKTYQFSIMNNIGVVVGV